MGAQQTPRHECDVLIRQIDRRLARLRTAANVDTALAERIADVLRRLVVDTAQASAADRARVRAAVHYFLVRRADDARVVNRIVRDLGHADPGLSGDPDELPLATG